jgi:glutamate-1-semialdehyde 2,1-aminomutase
MNYPESSPNSAKLFDRARAVMPGGNTRTTVYMEPFPIYAVRGAGCRLWDADGHVYIDCINNFTAMIHGHATLAINEVVRDQLTLGTAFGAPTSSEIDLAELLVSRLPSVDHVRFTNSGTEAVMMAIKAARAFTGRCKIAKIEGAYHGSYDYAEVSLDSAPDNWNHAPASIAYAKGTPQGVLDDVIALPLNDIAAARAAIAQHGRHLAAILIDPLPNRAGLIPARPDYLAALAEAARAAGVLLIFDEVISFRLGFGGAQGRLGIAPDLTALGKIIGGGFPVGAVAGRADVMSVFDPTRGKPALPHGGTFSANPVTMRAGLAAMQALTQASFERLDTIGATVRAGINAAFARQQLSGVCVGMGSLFKVHFTHHPVTDYRSVYPDAEARRRLGTFHRALLNRGVLAAGYGLFALSTPMTDHDITEIITAVDAALAEVARLGGGA